MILAAVKIAVRSAVNLRPQNVVEEVAYVVAVLSAHAVARDLDLIATPWVEECSEPDALIDALEERVDLFALRRRVGKPHGRLGYILCGRKWRNGDDHQPIDVSIMTMRSGRRIMQVIKYLIVKQPALIVGLVLAALGLAFGLGLVVTEELVAAVVAFVGALLAVLGAIFIYTQVTPVKAPEIPAGTDIRVKDPVTGVVGTGTVVVQKE